MAELAMMSAQELKQLINRLGNDMGLTDDMIDAIVSRIETMASWDARRWKSFFADYSKNVY